MRILFGTFLFLSFVVITYPDLSAQDRNISYIFLSKIKQADRLYKKGYVMLAIDAYKQVDQKSPTDSVKLRIAKCYQQLNQTEESEDWFNRIVDKNTTLAKDDVFVYAEVLRLNGKLENSLQWLQYYTNTYGADSISALRIRSLRRVEEFRQDTLNFLLHEIPLENVGGITFYKEELAFCKTEEKESMLKYWDRQFNQPFFTLFTGTIDSTKNIVQTTPFELVDKTKLNLGPLDFYNNDTRVFLTKSMSEQRIKKNQQIPVGLYYSEKKSSDEWGTLIPFPYNDRAFSNGHPSLSDDGKTLYYVSNRPGGYGGTDIYVSYWQDSTWSKPVNLGPQINTPGNECFPHVFNDSVLYFSSNGNEGLGGLDIFRAVKNDNQYWLTENVGAPINSSHHDYGIIFSENRKWGYFLSERKNTGANRMYQFDVIKVVATGLVQEHFKKKILTDVHITVHLNGKKVADCDSDEKGQFALKLNPGKEYEVVATKDGYLIKKAIVMTPMHSDTVTLKLVLEKDNRSFVKGIVKAENQVVPNIQVVAIAGDTHDRDTVVTNSVGGFSLETDPEQDYQLLAETDSLFGKISLKSSKERKGSFLFYTNILLHPYNQYDIECVVLENSMPVSNAKVLIHNLTLDHCDTLYTDAEGKCRYKAKSYREYSLSAYTDTAISIGRHISDAEHKNQFTIELKRKE